LFEIGNPDWRPLGWLHAAIAVSITLALIWKIGGKPWLTHFAFPVAFIFVAVPWISPIEAPIVQGLMRVVAWIASQTLNLCGVPAQLEGSVIRVNTGLVGVNEACSGVRFVYTDQSGVHANNASFQLKRSDYRYRGECCSFVPRS